MSNITGKYYVYVEPIYVQHEDGRGHNDYGIVIQYEETDPVTGRTYRVRRVAETSFCCHPDNIS